MWFRDATAWLSDAVTAVGDLTLFALAAVAATLRRPCPGTLLPCCYNVGVRSVPLVAVTGLFIGMLMAVQSYAGFRDIGLATHLGVIVNSSVVRELGPALAAVMLAGRVGSAMAAELATMRIGEQIDALACLGVNPVRYLVVPRLLACVLLIPLLAILADFTGVMGGAVISLGVFGLEPHHYWAHCRGVIGLWDLATAGFVKPTFFGAAIALISCHRGFSSRAGAEGVGQAATEAFVASFIAIFALDFVLALSLQSVHDWLWPR